MNPQTALPFDAPVSLVERAFLAWIETPDGKTVEADVTERALRLRRSGWKHFSMDAIWHAARFDRSLKVGPDGDGYRLNDRHTSQMARRLMERNPELAGLFELRKLRGRAWRRSERTRAMPAKEGNQ